MNCFIYSSQDFNNPQLISPLPNGRFNSYTYSNECNHAGSWSNGIARDIPGTGMGGTWVFGLDQCKQRCVNTVNCRAAQYSSGEPYYNNCFSPGHSGCNCYLYDNQNDDKAVTGDIRDFLLYKYHDNGQTDSWRRLQDSKVGAVIAV